MSRGLLCGGRNRKVIGIETCFDTPGTFLTLLVGILCLWVVGLPAAEIDQLLECLSRPNRCELRIDFGPGRL